MAKVRRWLFGGNGREIIPATVARHRFSPGMRRAYVGKNTIMRPGRYTRRRPRPGLVPGRCHAECGMVLAITSYPILQRLPAIWIGHTLEDSMGVKKTGKGRRKLGQKKRRMRARIRHRKG